MQIFIRSPAGCPSYTIDCEKDDTIDMIFEKLYDKNGIPPNEIYLFFKGKRLLND